MLLLIHHPPIFYENEESIYNDLLYNFNLILCGHTHSDNAHQNSFNGKARIITGSSIYDVEIRE